MPRQMKSIYLFIETRDILYVLLKYSGKND